MWPLGRVTQGALLSCLNVTISVKMFILNIIKKKNEFIMFALKVQVNL